jgi:uncharacterized metal-binding protein YceD (DUF177 family)
MSSHSEPSIYQKYRDLNIKSLLYYQAELLKLRKQLDEIDPARVKSLEAETHSVNDERLILMGKLRGVLSEYSRWFG